MPRLLLKQTTASPSGSSCTHRHTNKDQSVGGAKKKDVVPSQNDILSGRGKHNYCHHGNKYFLSLVKQYQFKCVTCPKSLKPVYARAIYSSLRKLDPPAKFLKATGRDNDVVVWQEMSHKETMAKIRQAMRDYEARMQRKRTSSFINHQFPKTVSSVDISKKDKSKNQEVCEENDKSSVPNQEKNASQLDVSMSSLRNAAPLGHHKRPYFMPIYHNNMYGTMNHADPKATSFGGHTYIVLNRMDINNLHGNVTVMAPHTSYPPMQLFNSLRTRILPSRNLDPLNNLLVPINSFDQA